MTEIRLSCPICAAEGDGDESKIKLEEGRCEDWSYRSETESVGRVTVPVAEGLEVVVVVVVAVGSSRLWRQGCDLFDVCAKA